MDAIKNVKRQPIEYEKIFEYYISDKRIIYRMYKEFLQLYNKKQITQFKNWQRTEKQFSKDIQLANKHMKRRSKSLTPLGKCN